MRRRRRTPLAPGPCGPGLKPKNRDANREGNSKVPARRTGVNELARAIGVRQPTASNLVRSLAAQDCIEIRKEGPDKRAVQLYVEAAARQV